MPIFEYVCDDCGTKFEKLVRGAESNGVLCPSCGHSHLTTQFSTFATHGNSAPKEQAMPSCPAGMCQTPDFCGRNF